MRGGDFAVRQRARRLVDRRAGATGAAPLEFGATELTTFERFERLRRVAGDQHGPVDAAVGAADALLGRHLRRESAAEQVRAGEAGPQRQAWQEFLGEPSDRAPLPLRPRG